MNKLLNAIGRWSTKDAPWWQFWMPQSGVEGGLILAAVLIAIFFALV